MSEISYDASQIKVLKFPETVRMRPGMYIGNTNEEGVEHMVLELVANVVDLFLAGRATKVSVKILGDQIVVADDGPGLPFDLEAPDQSMSLVEYFMTRMHHSPTFDGHQPHFHLASFGVGLAVVSALCKSINVDSWRNGARWSASFAHGCAFGSPTLVEEGNGRGTTITFQADATIFSETKPNSAVLRKKFFDAAHLVPGMLFELNDERFISQRGLEDMVYIFSNDGWNPGERVAPFYHRESIGDYEVHAAANGSCFPCSNIKLKNITVQSWVNGTPTPEHGSHVHGFQKALQQVAWLPETVLLHVITKSPKFSGRTRNQLCDEEVYRLVNSVLSAPLQKYIKELSNSA